MNKIRESRNKYAVMADYHIPGLDNKRKAVQWIIAITDKKIIDVDYISMDDNINRADEGSGSIKFYNQSDFTLYRLYNYICSHDIHHISVVGQYNGEFAVIGIDFSKFIMRITVPKYASAIIEKLTKDLELVNGCLLGDFNTNEGFSIKGTKSLEETANLIAVLNEKPVTPDTQEDLNIAIGQFHALTTKYQY